MTERRARPAGLGRGLNALLGDITREEPAEGSDRASGGVRMLSIDAITPHPDQPRRHFDETQLEELAQSIAARGIVQPIVVRPHGNSFQIVAGERRWRAARRARLHEVPVVVREFTDAETLEVALIENIQRQELNAVEEAQTYRRLIGEFGHTQDALARIVHKSRSHVTNLLRLLDLPDTVQSRIVEGTLSMGHARALIGTTDAEQLADQVIERGLSVRDTEKLARAAKGKGDGPDKVTMPGGKRHGGETGADGDIAALEQQLADLLGLTVRISHGDRGGSLTLGYLTLDQLDMICQRLTGDPI